MAGCMGVTSRAVVAVEAQGYTIHMVAPAVFPVSITVHTWEVWAQHTPNTHRLLLSRRNMFSRQQLRLRPPRYPMSTNVTRTPYTDTPCSRSSHSYSKSASWQRVLHASLV